MDKLDKYFDELNRYMEDEASGRDISFVPPGTHHKRKKLPLIAAAAAILVLPVITVTTWRRVSYNNLLREDNRLFLSSLMEEAATPESGLPSMGVFSDSDWFDMEKADL